MDRRILLVFLGLSLGVAGLAWAQPGPEMGGGFQDRFLELRRNQLGSALGADQRTVDRLLEIDQRYKPMRRQLTVEMKADFQHLQQLMSQPHPSEQDIQTVLNNMKRKRLEMLNLQQRKDDEETAILNPVQQARYILYLMNLVREARSIKSSPPAAPGGLPTMPSAPPREIPVSRPPQ
jgi:hypothetical protein